MTKKKKRRHFSGPEKVAILKRHLVDKVAVSNLPSATMNPEHHGPGLLLPFYRQIDIEHLPFVTLTSATSAVSIWAMVSLQRNRNKKAKERA